MNLDIGLLGQNVLLQTVYSGSQQYEQCDDGNQNEYDGCTSQCTLGTIGICGNGTIETIGGSTTSGTIDYAVSSSISMLTGYWTYDNFYQTGQIQVFEAQISSGTAVSYVWSFS